MDVFGGNWENHVDNFITNWNAVVQDDDIVLVAGDISWAMRLEETKTAFEWIDNLPGKKIIIKGNHEFWWKSISAVREILPLSIIASRSSIVLVQ